MALSSKLLFPLFFFLFGHRAYSQDSAEDFLDAHNAARSQVRVANIVWDETVAAFARRYADQRRGDCRLIHSGRDGGKYGENLAGSTGDLSGASSVKLWVDEKAYYDYNSNSCAGGKVCGHYAQVVWKNLISVGCAKVRCNNGGTFIGCNYYPPGNYVGQRPFNRNDTENIFCLFLSSESQIFRLPLE